MSELAPHVLIVDGDQTFARTLSRLLTQNGYEATALSTGAGLPEFMATRPVDLLLLDLSLPGEDGFTVLEMLRRIPDYRNFPVLALSTETPSEQSIRAMGLGASDLIAKPVRARDLLARIRVKLRAGRDLNRSRTEARAQAVLAALMKEITVDLPPRELYQVLVRQVAAVLRIPRCSILLGRPGAGRMRVVAASDNPMLTDLSVDTSRYPEIQQALSTGEVVLVRDAATDPLYRGMNGIETVSSLVLPFSLRGERSACSSSGPAAGTLPSARRTFASRPGCRTRPSSRSEGRWNGKRRNGLSDQPSQLSALRCPRCGATFDPPARFCTKDGFPLVPGSAPPPTTPRAFGLHRTGEVRVPPARRGDPASGLSGRVMDGRYQMEMRVGEGGMAYVYRAKDRDTGRTVALKVLMSRLTGDPEAMARLRREAQVAMRLDHPNVCGILAWGDAAGMPYLVMPFLDGETLSRRETRHGPMPAPLAVPFLKQLCRGLSHAHAAGVLHRDLKPENVMLVTEESGGERAVVMDFGLAKESVAGPELTKLTATGIVLGTPEFMSPEQIRGKPLDARSDIFALGVLGFELLTGRLPFEGNTAQETMLAHLTGQPLRLRQVNAAMSEELERVIAQSIAHRPEERFQTMQDFEEALENSA